MKKIDIHCHTSNRKILATVSSSADINFISKKMLEHNVEKTVLLATYFPHKGSGITNFRLHNWIDSFTTSVKNNKFLMFGSLDFEVYYRQGLNELTEMIERNLISGIKFYTCYQNIDLKNSKLRDVLILADINSLPVMFHTGLSYSSMRKYGKPTIATQVNASSLEHLVKDFPSVNFIFSHMSKPFLMKLCMHVNILKMFILI